MTTPEVAVDWASAVRAGQRFAPTGPVVTPGQARQAVVDLRTFSAETEEIVRETTGLGAGLPIGTAQVVDRAGWIEATAEGMAVLTAPMVERVAAKAPRSVTLPGAQLGVVLGYLSGRVLGQYDPLTGTEPSGEPGRLLLVAPNIIKVERELDADPTDFRRWVCLHESTHRLQFTAVPWLRDHFKGLAVEFAEAADIDPGELIKRAASAVSGGGSWVERIQSPAQRAVFDRMMALMTLLEGHADHVMDAVGPSVVPTVTQIRAAFTQRRRKNRGPLDRLLRALLGMDMKMAQYVKGAAFVDAVVGKVGMEQFNTVWTSVETLPTRDEIADPDGWIARVLS